MLTFPGTAPDEDPWQGKKQGKDNADIEKRLRFIGDVGHDLSGDQRREKGCRLSE